MSKQQLTYQFSTKQHFCATGTQIQNQTKTTSSFYLHNIIHQFFYNIIFKPSTLVRSIKNPNFTVPQSNWEKPIPNYYPRHTDR